MALLPCMGIMTFKKPLYSLCMAVRFIGLRYFCTKNCPFYLSIVNFVLNVAIICSLGRRRSLPLWVVGRGLWGTKCIMTSIGVLIMQIVHNVFA